MSFLNKFLLRLCVYIWLFTVIILSLMILLFGTIIINRYLIMLFVGIIFLISYKFSVTEDDKYFFIKIFSNKKNKSIFLLMIFLFLFIILLSWQMHVRNQNDVEVSMIYSYLLFIISLPGSLLIDIFGFMFGLARHDDFNFDTMVLERIRIFLVWLNDFLIFVFQIYVITKKLMVKWAINGITTPARRLG